MSLYVSLKREINYDSLSFQGEESFIGDRLVEGGHLTNGKGYREVREYVQPYILVRFYFVTRAYYSYTETILTDLYLGEKPDVLIMNSCLWDISRFELSFFSVFQSSLLISETSISFTPLLRYEVSPPHIPEQCSFRLQPKHFHVIIYTLFPKSSCQYTSPQPPPYFYRPTHNTDKIVSPSAIYSVSW